MNMQKDYQFCSPNFCVMQAAYNIGGHTISVDTIQNSILQCRLLCPGKVGHSTALDSANCLHSFASAEQHGSFISYVFNSMPLLPVVAAFTIAIQAEI